MSRRLPHRGRTTSSSVVDRHPRLWIDGFDVHWSDVERFIRDGLDRGESTFEIRLRPPLPDSGDDLRGARTPPTGRSAAYDKAIACALHVLLRPRRH